MLAPPINRFMAELVAGDETLLRLNLVGRNGSRLNLVGGSVDLRWRVNGGARTDVSMTLETPATGVVTYRFGSGALAVGRLTADVRVTDSGGFAYSNRNPLSFEVRKQV